MNYPFDKIYLIRQLCHASKRLSDAFPSTRIEIKVSPSFQNLLFCLVLDTIDQTKNILSFKYIMDDILRDKMAVWQHLDVQNLILVPEDLMYHMISDPAVRSWLLEIRLREDLENL